MYLFIYLFKQLNRVSKSHRATLETSAIILGTKKAEFKKCQRATRRKV